MKNEKDLRKKLKEITNEIKTSGLAWRFNYSCGLSSGSCFGESWEDETRLDNQQTIRGNNTNTSPSVPQKVKELSEVGCDRKLPSSADTLQKGCGKYVKEWNRHCGEIEDLKHSDNIILCSECRAKTKEDKNGI